MTNTHPATTGTISPQPETPAAEALAKFRGLVYDFDTAMLVSSAKSGHQHGRPMRIVGRHRDNLDDIWFVANFESQKVDELRAEPRVAVVLADGKRFVSISGWASVVVDSDKIEHMWNDSWKAWFPEGPLSPDLCLIQIRPHEAEYWDQSFPQGVRVTLETLRAWLTEEPVDLPEGPAYHAKVRLLG